MLFNSFIFFVFLGVVLPIFYFLPTRQSKNIFLVAASYFFYGYWDWRFCSLLAVSTIIDYLVGRKMHQTSNVKKRKGLLAISLLANLGILGFFKYFNFFVDSFQMLTERMGLHLDYLHLTIILPVGISFYTFQTLSYTIDIYRKKLKPTHNFVDFALFVSFFPQLVAGPIERARALLPQLSEKLKPNREQIQQGIVLIVMGLFRKVMIGDTAGRFVDNIFQNLELYKSVEILAALILFSVQIYADFSGYSHIARGTAKLLGIELMKNFQQPYLSRNITEFWRRWHISLSSWLKDYLYISLGGNRKGNIQTYINLMLTMLLGGLWHGASWNFVIWGGLHGLYLAVHKMFLGNKKIEAQNMDSVNFRNVFNIFITFVLVLITWLFFRSTSWDTTTLFISKLVNWEQSEHTLLFVTVTLAYLAMTYLLDVLEYSSRRHTYLLKIRSHGVKLGVLSAMFFITLVYMFQAEPAPFIYFQF
ncbi:MBOAT family O-acyltransferase [Marinilabilia rubra]|uniref:Membrane-bound O-acyltransferase family protein n=1 Tax=Marinilabilia rubra TaxID=2162893 RepID=A0A2U2B434_9BACT|nr:MBOAT family O-acyltransferase [Marinilabilia rubra]PWD97832.1 membrane-bound O-acyltransferase family protein [Marinilabilia rubra]